MLISVRQRGTQIMKTWNPLTLSLLIALVIHIGIIPWAAWQGTLNWQVGPLYLLFTIPASVVIIMIGLVVSLVRG